MIVVADEQLDADSSSPRVVELCMRCNRESSISRARAIRSTAKADPISRGDAPASRALSIFMQRRTDVTMIRSHTPRYAPMNPRMQLHPDHPAGMPEPGRAYRTGFGLQYKLRREKRTADKLINKSAATARAIILRARGAASTIVTSRRTAF